VETNVRDDEAAFSKTYVIGSPPPALETVLAARLMEFRFAAIAAIQRTPSKLWIGKA